MGFKIQANIDPGHHDRIAFIRVCSGHFESGMCLKNCRTGKDFRPNHGVLQLGDTLTEGENSLNYG